MLLVFCWAVSYFMRLGAIYYFMRLGAISYFMRLGAIYFMRSAQFYAIAIFVTGRLCPP